MKPSSPYCDPGLQTQLVRSEWLNARPLDLRPTRRIRHVLLLLVALILPASMASPVVAQDADFGADSLDPLPVEEAFQWSITALDRDTVRLDFEPADGYYLYRDKLSFRSGDEQNVTLGEPTLPAALTIEDEFFGKSAIYREPDNISLPISVPATSEELALTVRYQGCADFGLCYPPTDTVLTARLPPAEPSADRSSATFRTAPSAQIDALADLFDSGSGNADHELLSPNRAFVPEVTRAGTDGIVLDWRIEPGYYLYRDKLTYALESADGARIETARVEPGLTTSDEFFGEVVIWRDSGRSILELDSIPADRDADLVIGWQGCADIGVCFPPQTSRLPVRFDQGETGIAALLADLDADSGGAEVASAMTAETAPLAAGVPGQSEQDRLSGLLASSSLWLTALSFFGFGLLLAFTPCVLPMVPILSSLIVGQGNISTRRAFQLSSVYVLVMASTYAVVGIFVGLSGYNVQALLQNPIVLSSLALLFVVLAAAMFGAYELQMPLALQERLTNWSSRQRGGSIGGVAAMGFISTLIVGPCVTAPLAGALLYIANTGDAVIGGVALFCLGLGMGAPLLLIGTSAGNLVPRAGAWMSQVKALFGFLMLAMAIWMLSRFLPATLSVAMGGVLAVVAGVHFGAFDRLLPDTGPVPRLAKASGLVMALYGLALLAGALAGQPSWTRPLAGVVGSGSGEAHAELRFQPIKSVDDLDARVAAASAEGRAVMLDFYADWCISCKEMERFTFTDRGVQARLDEVVLLQADVTANDAIDQALLERFQLFGPPGIIFYDASGRELPAARVVGFMSADRFGAHIDAFGLGDTMAAEL